MKVNLVRWDSKLYRVRFYNLVITEKMSEIGKINGYVICLQYLWKAADIYAEYCLFSSGHQNEAAAF